MNVFAVQVTERISGTLKTEHIEALRQHERTDKKHLNTVKKSILKEGLNFPIVADKKTKLVLDGHHRLNALKELGVRNIPAMYVAREKAIELGPGKKIVVIFPDNGFKYLSTPLFEECATCTKVCQEDLKK